MWISCSQEAETELTGVLLKDAQGVVDDMLVKLSPKLP